MKLLNMLLLSCVCMAMSCKKKEKETPVPTVVYRSASLYFLLQQDIDSPAIVYASSMFTNSGDTSIAGGNVYCNDVLLTYRDFYSSLPGFVPYGNDDEFYYIKMPLSVKSGSRTWRATGDTVGTVIVPPFTYTDDTHFPDTGIIPHTCNKSVGLTLTFANSDSVQVYGLTAINFGTYYMVDYNTPKRAAGQVVNFNPTDLQWLYSGQSTTISIRAYKTDKTTVSGMPVTTTKIATWKATIVFN